MNPRLPRLALSVVGKPSFIRKRLEALREFGSNPFHPRRAMFAGLAVTLGIVAVMTVMFGRATPFSLGVLKFEDVKVTTNQQTLAHNDLYLEIEKSEIGLVGIENKGLYLFSIAPFADARKEGYVLGSTLVIPFDHDTLTVSNNKPVAQKITLQSNKIPLYIKKVPHYNLDRFGGLAKEEENHREGIGMTSYNDYWKNEQELVRSIKVDFAFRRIGRYEDLFPEIVRPEMSFFRPEITLGGFPIDPLETKTSMFNEGLDRLPICQNDDLLVVLSRYIDGHFVFSTKYFDGATQAAVVNGKYLEVNTPKGKMRIESRENILRDTTNNQIWFGYYPFQRQETNPAGQYRRDFIMVRFPRPIDFDWETFNRDSQVTKYAR